MKFRETLARWTKRGQSKGLKVVLQDLSEELRSDAVPAALRQAAQAVAGLLDGQSEASGAASPNAVIINISVAVAVGAPGKEQESDSKAGAPPNEAVVIASAVATAPAMPRPKRSAEEQAKPASGGTRSSK